MSHLAMHSRGLPGALAALLLISLVMPPPAPASPNGARGVANPRAATQAARLLIELEPGASVGEVRSALGGLGGRVLRSSRGGDSPTLVCEVPGDRVLHATKELCAEPSIAGVKLDSRMRASFVPNDAKFSLQWHLSTVRAPQAWDRVTGSSAVTIAIIDSGVRANHPDLSGAVRSDGAWDYVESDAIPDDDMGHGTLVAGLAAATMNNGIGVAGVASGARILPIKVLDGQGYGWTSDVVDGIRRAADNGADVINLSLGSADATDHYDELAAALAYARARGCIVVAAAGNGAKSAVEYPAAMAGVIAVGASTSTNLAASFSNRGDALDVLAPGVEMWSTAAGGGYDFDSGTSFATPVVSGIAALIRSARPYAVPEVVEDAISNSAVDIAPGGWDSASGFGVVDAAQALQAAGVGSSSYDPEPPVTTLSGVPDGWGREPTAITFAAKDEGSGVANTYYQLGDGLETPVPPELTLGEGVHDLTYWSVDRAGNKEPAKHVTVSVDTTPPYTKATVIENDSGAANVTLRASDTLSGVAGTWYSLDGGAASRAPLPLVEAAGPHSLAYWSVDRAGNVEATRTVAFNAYLPTRLSISPSRATTAFRAAKTIKAKLYAGEGVVPSVSVRLERSYDGKSWKLVSTTSTDASGTAAFEVAPAKKTRYRAVFRRFGDLGASSSSSAIITPRARLGTPSVARSTRVARTVTVRGSLQPHHRKGDRSVLVRFYHREGGQWVLRRGLTAVNRDYVDYTRYSVTVRLPSNGTWRVRVQHSDSDHAFTSQYSASFRVP